ncbi:MAG: stage V sporulation protein AA [Lachnospiraceae bacterium]
MTTLMLCSREFTGKDFPPENGRMEESMADTICYIKLDRNVEVTSEDVFLKDAGSVRCADSVVAAKVKSIKIHKFHQESGKEQSGNKGKEKYEGKRCVISVLKIIELIEEACPGVTVESLGNAEVLVEWISVNKHKGWQQGLKILLVSVVSFFGTAFTIISYHNDTGIADIFAGIYRIVMGSEPEGVSILEVAYSAGLALGIIVFFNHVGGRRLTKDPTPIEVEMRVYEKDVNDALVETAEREGRTIDVS